jgi:hypothetical protein
LINDLPGAGGLVILLVVAKIVTYKICANKSRADELGGQKFYLKKSDNS